MDAEAVGRTDSGDGDDAKSSRCDAKDCFRLAHVGATGNATNAGWNGIGDSRYLL